MSSPSSQPAPVTPPPARGILAPPLSQRRDAPLPPLPNQEPASVGTGGPLTMQQGAVVPDGAPAGMASTGMSTAMSASAMMLDSSAPTSATAQESTTPVSAPPTAQSVPVPAAPSPAKPVAGQKHQVRRLDEFVNKKSIKKAVGTSAQPLSLKATPKKKRVHSVWTKQRRQPLIQSLQPIGPVVEQRVAGASEFLYQQPRAARSGSDVEQHAHERSGSTSARATRPLRPPRASSAMLSRPVPPEYPNTPHVAQQQPAVPQQQLMHQQMIPQQTVFQQQAIPQQAVLQQQAMAHQQLFQQPQMPQQQPQMFQSFMQVPAPMAYALPMQTPNQVLAYHGFPQPALVPNAGPSVWNDYHDVHQEDDMAQRYSTPRRVRTRQVHYDLDPDDGDNHKGADDGYGGTGEDSDDEEEPDENDQMEYQHQYDLDDNDLEYENDGPDKEELMEEVVQDDEMQDINNLAPETTNHGEQAQSLSPHESEPPRPTSSQNPREELRPARDRQRSLSQGPNDVRERASKAKGKERATEPSTSGPSTRWAEHALPNQGGESYFLLLLQQFSEFNELQREENKLNRQWQQNMMQYVKNLDHKITRGPAAVARGTNGRSSGSRVKVNRDRASNSMASRIIIEPRDQPMSPEDLKRLEEKEKGHLANLQNVVRVHFKKMLGVTSYKEMAAKNPPLDDDKIFEYEMSGPQYFTADNFRVDFVQAWKEFPFNLSARDFFANHLARVLKGGGYKKAAIPPRYHMYDHIAEALDVHMDHACRRYREAVDPPDADEVEKGKCKARMVSQRGTLYTSCFRVTKHVEKYSRFQDIFINLQGAHMSADETDIDDEGKKMHPVTFTIICAAWMSFAFRRLCRELDKENIKNRGVLIGDQGSGGNGPRVREDSTPAQEAETRAPVGLWRDCYDSAWLSSLKNDQIRRLDIINEDFGLELPQTEEEEEEEEEEEATA